MATLLIDRINDESFRQLSRMAVHVLEGPAELSGLGFDGFKKRLKEYFSTGYIVASETVKDDLQADRQIPKKV